MLVKQVGEQAVKRLSLLEVIPALSETANFQIETLLT